MSLNEIVNDLRYANDALKLANDELKRDNSNFKSRIETQTEVINALSRELTEFRETVEYEPRGKMTETITVNDKSNGKYDVQYRPSEFEINRHSDYNKYYAGRGRGLDRQEFPRSSRGYKPAPYDRTTLSSSRPTSGTGKIGVTKSKQYSPTIPNTSVDDIEQRLHASRLDDDNRRNRSVTNSTCTLSRTSSSRNIGVNEPRSELLSSSRRERGSYARDDGNEAVLGDSRSYRTDTPVSPSRTGSYSTRYSPPHTPLLSPSSSYDRELRDREIRDRERSRSRSYSNI